jgi:hypothetical protein
MSISASEEESSSSGTHSTEEDNMMMVSRDDRQRVHLRITEDKEDFPPPQRSFHGRGARVGGVLSVIQMTKSRRTYFFSLICSSFHYRLLKRF